MRRSRGGRCYLERSNEDIINALQKIYDCNVPVFLDNAERINSFNVPDMECQLITLSVSEDDELKVREI